MSADGEFSGQLAIAEDFHTMSAAIGEAGLAQSRFIDASAIVEAIERLQIHRQISRRVPCVVETSFWNTANQWHLAAFKSNADGTAGAGSLALAAASAGFAVATRLALAETFTAVLGTRTGF